jgi:hypothetical protein
VNLPREFPSLANCCGGSGTGGIRGLGLDLAGVPGELNEKQQLKWSESFLNGSFAPAKKGAPESERPSEARGRSG